MKPLLNTLYVTLPDARVLKEGEAVCVRANDEIQARIPIHTLSGIVCIGEVWCSQNLMSMAAENGVSLSFLSNTGRFLARVHGPVTGNVLLRVAQYRAMDSADRAGEIARNIVVAKLANSRVAVLRAARENEGDAGLDAAALRLLRLCEDVSRCSDVDVIRGIEGDGARVYFSVFDRFISAQKDGFFWRGRSRRPPMDNMNALLSFLYTLLVHDVAGALECVGLDPAVGYLHALRPGRPSLALDLMEELRPMLPDRLALTLINRRQISADNFRECETGGVAMDDDTRREVLIAWQKRKQEVVTHPFLEERVPVGLIPHVQAMLLARHLRGDLNEYPPFLWR